MKNNFISKSKAILVIALITLLFGNWVNAQTNYTLVTSNVDLIVGEKYIIASGGSGQIKAMGYQNSNNRPAATTTYTVSSSTVVLTSAVTTGTLTDVYEFTLGGSTGSWTLFDPIYNGYLNAAGAGGGSNYLRTLATNDAKGIWTINIDNSTSIASITSNGGATRNWMRFNSSNNPQIFACYTSGQADIYLYKAGVSTPMPEINVKQNTTNVLNNGTYNFGTTPDGSTLVSTFTLENTGTAPLNVTSATFTGSSDFTVNTTLPLTISASSSTTFSVTFAPTSVGSLTASIAFDNDDSDENPYTINFVGNSIAAIPEINCKQNVTDYLNNSMYSFAPIIVGNTSIATFTIQNIGGATLNITSTTFSGNPEFSVTSDYSAPFSIAYGDFATFTATFSPGVVNSYSASITLSNDDSDENQYVVNFYGEAIAPFSEINIKQATTQYASGTTYNYGSKAVSSTTDITFTIENLGNSVLNINTYTLTGSEFSLQGTMSTTINAGSSSTFVVRFTPSSATTFSGNISVDNNDGNENPYIINFAGTGVLAQPEINVKESGINYFNGTTYDFANRTVGTNSDVTFTIENNDSGVLLISTHTLTGSAYSIVGTIPPSINGNSTANFTLRFSPQAAVAYTGALTLVNNDANESSYVINLTGNGIALPATPDLKINEIMANPSSGNDWFEIYNPGSTAVNLSGLYVSNSTLTKYKFLSGSPSIPAGGFVQVMANNGGQISPLEVNFTLSNTDEVFLYSYDGTTIIDQLAVTDAVAGQSQGRVTDGGAELMSFSTATPGATNTAGVGVVSVRELSMSEKLILAPNPSSSVFTISYANLSNEKTFAYRVIDITGKEVLSGNTNAVSGLNIYPIDVTSIAKGLYFIECVVGNEKVTNKIVVE